MSGPDQTPQMPDDRELEDFLAGRGKVREAYHAAAQEQAPTAIDDAILQMAAKAAAEQPAVFVRKPRALRRWQPSLAAAAVLVLSFGVFFQMKKDPVAERAVFAPSEDALTQEIATAQSATPSPASSSAVELQKQKALASADQAQRQKREMKEEVLEARRAAVMAAAPASAAIAESEAEAGMSPPLAKAAPELEQQGFALQDSAAPKPAAAPPPPSLAMAGKMLRAAPMERAAAVAAAPAIQAEPLASISENDLWTQTCSSDMAFNAPSHDQSVMLKTPRQWQGLSVVGFGAGALVFAPDVSREAVLERLNGLKDAATCLEPAPKGQGVRLLCRCVKP